MSVIGNPITLGVGSTSADDGILFNNSYVKPDVGYFVLRNGSDNGFPLFQALTVSGRASSIQYAYLVLGPINLTTINTITAVFRGTVESGSVHNSLFIASTASARSWNTDGALDVNSSKSIQTRTLDVSAVEGDWYIYVGTDSNNSSWNNVRTATIYGVKVS